MDRLGKERLFVVVLVGCIAVAAACASKCLQIQDVLCQCQGQTQEERTVCQDNASAQESLAPPTDQQNKVCAQLLPGCTDLIDGGSIDGCNALKTDQGKKICGLSR